MWLDSGAKFSDDRVYRYRLWRIWDRSLPIVLFIGLNPSTADEKKNDPTVTRCINFAKRWGTGGIYMGNIFALRATDPNVMMNHSEPIGVYNNYELKQMILRCHLNVACWGTKGLHLGQGMQVAQFFSGFKCLGITKDGHPKHPLYLRNDTELIDWLGY